MVILEIQTRLDDLGGAERQLGWYERHAVAAAHRLGWRPRRVLVWLVVLESDEVDQVLVANRDLISQAFPRRAKGMLATLAGSDPIDRRSIAMINPGGRRARWLIPTRLDGRRSAAPYRDYSDAAKTIRGRRR